MNTYFVSYETLIKGGNINLPKRRGWVTLSATVEEISEIDFLKPIIVNNIKIDEDIDLEKESILILNISKLN